MTHRAAREAGFTLLETLVALVVLGLLIGGLGQGLRFGLWASHRQMRLIDRYADLDAVDRTLRGVIEQIDPGNAHDAPTVLGNKASMRFTSELPAGAAALLMRRAEMGLLVDSSQRLVLRWAPYTHAERIGPAPTPTDTMLIQDVDHIELSYRAKSSRDGQSWQKDWRASEVPGFVRIQLVFPPRSGLQWPAIIASTKLARP